MTSRIEPGLAPRYSKDRDEEDFLMRLNRVLEPHHEQELQDLPEVHPTLFIVGVPRSGTTLLSQVLANHTNIGFVNNLAAAFWRAPVYGIRLAMKLAPPLAGSSFRSEFGRTQGVSEPHEFGYFWSSLLRYQEMLERGGAEKHTIDWARVRRILINMADAVDRPMMFKSLLASWHITDIHRILEKACWIHIERDPIQTALSLVETRSEFLGSVDTWASLKPLEYSWLKNEPYWRQVAGQVYFLKKRHKQQLGRIPRSHAVRVEYEEVCRNPAAILERVATMINSLGGSLKLTNGPAEPREVSIRPVEDYPISAKLEAAWQSLLDAESFDQ